MRRVQAPAMHRVQAPAMRRRCPNSFRYCNSDAKATKTQGIVVTKPIILPMPDSHASTNYNLEQPYDNFSQISDFDNLVNVYAGFGGQHKHGGSFVPEVHSIGLNSLWNNQVWYFSDSTYQRRCIVSILALRCFNWENWSDITRSNVQSSVWLTLKVQNWIFVHFDSKIINSIQIFFK